MQTSRLTRTFRRASWRVPVARLVLTTAGSSCGVMPTAIARENSSDSIERALQQQVRDEDQRGEPDSHLQQQEREPLQPELEFGLGLPFSQAQRDTAEFGAAAGGHHDAGAAAGLDDGSHEDAGCEVAQGRAGRHRGRILAGWQGLPRQDAFVAEEVLGAEEADVGGDDGAQAQVYDVARHQGGHVHVLRGSVAQHDGAVGHPGVQGFGRAFGAEFVGEAQAHADQEDHADHDRIRGIAQEQGQPGRDDQQDEDGAGELPAQHRPAVGPVRPHGVRAEFCKARRGFLVCQAGRAGAEVFEHLVRRKACGLGDRQLDWSAAP